MKKKIIHILTCFLFTFIYSCLQEVPIRDISISNIVVQSTKFTSQISWKTNKCTNCKLSCNGSVYSTNGFSHNILITSLLAATNYDFSITADVCTSEPVYSNSSYYEGQFATDSNTVVSISLINESSITCSTINITWQTDIESSCVVNYGLDSSYGSVKLASTSDNKNHNILLTSLNNNTTYHYQIVATPITGGWLPNQTTDRVFSTQSVDPVIINNINETGKTYQSISLSWTTDVNSNCTVDYGLNTSYGNNIVATTSDNLNHFVTISGLSSSTTYHYRINASTSVFCRTNGQSIDNVFTTNSLTTVSIYNIISNPGMTDVTVTWNTDILSNCTFDYGLTSSYGNTISAITSDNLVHSISISSLSSDTTYHYRINANPIPGGYSSNSTSDLTFTTLSIKKFCIIADTASTTAATSLDGITWASTSNMPAKDWRSIASNGSLFVVVAANFNICVTSPDGVTWTQRLIGSNSTWVSVTWNGSVFCAVARNSFWVSTSPDGITWTERNMGVTSRLWNQIAAGNGVFVVVAESTNIAAISSDNGVTWVERTLPAIGQWYSICWDGTTFFAVIYGSNNGATSPTGVTWTLRTMPVSRNWGVAGANSSKIIVAEDNSGNYAYSSNNGISWTYAAFPVTGFWRSIAWNGTIFCLVKKNSNVALTSPDGITWTQRLLPSSTPWVSIVWSN